VIPIVFDARAGAHAGQQRRTSAVQMLRILVAEEPMIAQLRATLAAGERSVR
jgi:hypothetical protein